MVVEEIAEAVILGADLFLTNKKEEEEEKNELV